MRTATAVLAGLVGLSLAGCNGIPPEPFVIARAASQTPAPPQPVTAEALQSSFSTFAAAHPGGLALAWAPVGEPDRVQVMGSTRDSDAWSTIKVPIAIAAGEDAVGQDVATVQARTREAIRRSDNAAATALWRSLGGTSAAQQKTDAVLRAGGDDRTEAAEDAEGARRGFGRTLWRVDDAARFASMLPCLPEAEYVLENMGQIDPDHRWGVGALQATSRFKGGWGPSDHGYLVRQIGVVDSGSGALAVALAVQPENGTHATATATASAAADWLVGHLGPADMGVCAAPPAG